MTGLRARATSPKRSANPEPSVLSLNANTLTPMWFCQAAGSIVMAPSSSSMIFTETGQVAPSLSSMIFRDKGQLAPSSSSSVIFMEMGQLAPSSSMIFTETGQQAPSSLSSVTFNTQFHRLIADLTLVFPETDGGVNWMCSQPQCQVSVFCVPHAQYSWRDLRVYSRKKAPGPRIME